MKKKVCALLMALPLLTACSSFSGLAKESYDGRTLDRNEEALSTYHPQKEMIGEEKDALQITFPDFFFQAPLAFVGEEMTMPILEEPIVIGEDLPEGRYTIFKNLQSGRLTVADSKGDVLYEQVLQPSMGHLELNLYDGMQITANSDGQPRLMLTNTRLDSTIPGMMVVGGEEAPPLEEGQYQITNGVYHVGVDITPGHYAISQSASFNTGVNYFYLLKEDRTFELLSSFRELANASLSLELSEGQIFYVTNLSSLNLIPIDAE